MGERLYPELPEVAGELAATMTGWLESGKLDVAVNAACEYCNPLTQDIPKTARLYGSDLVEWCRAARDTLQALADELGRMDA